MNATVRACLLAGLLVLVGAAVGVVVVGGQSPNTAITTPTNGPGQQWRRDSAYLTAVRGKGVDGTDGELLDTARTVCADAGSGRDLPGLVVYVQQRHHVDAQVAGFVVSEAVKTQCPQRYDQLGRQGSSG